MLTQYTAPKKGRKPAAKTATGANSKKGKKDVGIELEDDEEIEEEKPVKEEDGCESSTLPQFAKHAYGL